MKLQYFRFSVVELEQSSLDGLIESKKKSKHQIFVEILRENYKAFSFKHTKSELGFLISKSEGNFLYAKFGKKNIITRTESPEKGFVKQNLENWLDCLLFINLDPDKQIMALEYKTGIFDVPLNQLRALAKQINASLSIFSLELIINPILEVKNFWDVVRENEGKIDELIFEFTAPNVLNLKSTLNEDLKEAKKVFGMTRATVAMKNDAGKLIIPQDNPLVKQSLEYASQGGGDIKIKYKRAKIYASDVNANIKSNDVKDVTELEIDGMNSEDFKNFMKTLF